MFCSLFGIVMLATRLIAIAILQSQVDTTQMAIVNVATMLSIAIGLIVGLVMVLVGHTMRPVMKKKI